MASRSFQPVQGGDAFGEDDEAVRRLGGAPVERLATLDGVEQCLVLGVVGWSDPRERIAECRQGRDLGFPGRGVLPIRDLPLPPLDALVDGLDARRRTGKERLFERHREEIARRRFRPAAGDPDRQQRVVRRFLGRGCGKPLRKHLPVPERIAHLIPHVLLEATNHQTGPEVLPGEVVRVGDGSCIQHVDEAREAARLAVVGCGGEHDERVGPSGEQPGQAIALGSGAPVRDVVRLVDDDDVPRRLFQVGAVLRVLLQCIDGDDRLVVVVERIVVGRDTAAHPLDADGVQAGQGNGKAVPELLLELRQHALHGQHQDAPAATPRDELADQDTGFQCLAEPHRIRDQDALAGPCESLTCGIELIVHAIHCGGVPDVNLRIVRHGLAELALHVEDAVGELGGVVGNELRFRRIEHLDGGLQRGEKYGFAPAHELGDAVTNDLIPTGRVVHASDDPLRVAHDDSGSGGGYGDVAARQ